MPNPKKINPATGRPHSEDKRINAIRDRSYAEHGWNTGPAAGSGCLMTLLMLPAFPVLALISKRKDK